MAGQGNLKLSVPLGICSGIVAGLLYNRFHAIKLPDYLSFFGGAASCRSSRALAGLVFAAAFGLGFPWFEAGIDALSHWVLGAGSLGLFLYGLLNRLLLITGLHHIINNIAWFLLGDFHGATGDIKRFFAGDPTAGSFMARLLPGDDVRPARGLLRHVSQRASSSARRSAGCCSASRSPRCSPA